MDITTGLSIADGLVDSGRLITDLIASFGWTPIPRLPVVKTDNAAQLAILDQRKAPWIACTCAINPGGYQRGISKDTNSLWQHNHFGIGAKLGEMARLTNPGKVFKHPDPDWFDEAGRPRTAGPVPIIGIDPVKNQHPSKYEIVQSEEFVEVNDLMQAIRPGEQVILFTFPDLTDAQRLAMAIEAYSWVGKFYDIAEISKRFFWFIPNPKWLKVCATLMLPIWEASGDKRFRDWLNAKGLDPEEFAPRDTFNFCMSPGVRAEALSFNCKLEDAA